MRKVLTAAIHLVMLMAVTSSVVAENAPKRLTDNLNLPPEAIDFDLSDLIDADQQLRDQKQRDEWTAYQDKMTAAYAETKTFVDSGSDTAAGIEAWQRFLKAFDADNPFAKEDDSMRAQAKNAMLGLEEVERTLQSEWSDYQDKMTKAYQDVLAFLGTKPDLNLRTQSINRFLEAFSADNPFSEEDDAMRSDARDGLTTIELLVTASNGAAEIYSTESQGDFGYLKRVNGLATQGKRLFDANKLKEAKIAFLLALHLVHREEGLFGINQLPIINNLTATNLRERNSLAADQQQRFSLKVEEQSYGPNSIEILPTLTRLGSYFANRGDTISLAAVTELRMQRAILFKDSVNLYHRAIDIIELNYGVNDLRLLTPLRGLAMARTLEITQRRNAEAPLLRSLEIVDSNPNSDLADRAQAMVDLGDFYIITSDKQAQEIYLNAWTILQETPETQQLASSLFDSPVRLYPRIPPFLYLERTPDGVTTGDELFVNLQYDVSPNGHVRGIELIDRNVSNRGLTFLRQFLRASRFRPRIHNGELVSTEALEIRQLFTVLNNKPLPDDKREKEGAPIADMSKAEK
jgi:hypothetical protein